MAASFHGHSDVVEMFIETNAEIDTQDEVCFYIPLKNTQHIITQSFVV